MFFDTSKWNTACCIDLGIIVVQVRRISLPKFSFFSFMSRAHSFPWQEGFIHVWGLHASFISSHLSIFRGKRVLSSETKSEDSDRLCQVTWLLSPVTRLQGGDIRLARPQSHACPWGQKRTKETVSLMSIIWNSMKTSNFQRRWRESAGINTKEERLWVEETTNVHRGVLRKIHERQTVLVLLF